MADQTEFQKLQGAIAGNRQLQDQLNKIIDDHTQYGSDLDRHAALGDFARQVAAQELSTRGASSFDPSKVVESFSATQQPIAPTQQGGDALTQQGQQGRGGVLAAGAKGFMDQQHEQHIVRYDTAAPSVQSEQQERLLQEYEQALATENTVENPEAREDAIKKVLAKLDAQSLLKDQIAISKRYLHDETFSKDKGDKKKYFDALAAAEKRIDDEIQKRVAAEQNLSEEERAALVKKREEENLLRERASSVANEEEAKKAFRELLNKRQQETNQYDIFQEMAGKREVGGETLDGDAYIFGITLAISAAQSARERQQNEQQGHADEELYGMQQQEQQRQNLATQAFNLGRGAQSARGGAARSLARRGFSQLLNRGKKFLNRGKKFLLEKGAQILLTQPEVLIPILLVAFAVFLIFIIVIAVVVFVAYLTSQSSSNSLGGTPQNVAALVSVAQEIETCERWKYGFHAPSPSCVTALNLPASYGSEIQGFVNEINRGYANFQCGQYIWAAQKYVLNWIPFPGNVATVYNWYTIHANHTLQGYNWIPNPDNPIWGNSSAPANILPGDIILYGSVGASDPGHIAIVTTVQSDSFNIIVTEANYYHGVIDLRPTNLHDGLGRGAYILGWWRRQ